jgi:hypothetical protein
MQRHYGAAAHGTTAANWPRISGIMHDQSGAHKCRYTRPGYQFGHIESRPFWLVVRRVRFVPSGLMR